MVPEHSPTDDVASAMSAIFSLLHNAYGQGYIGEDISQLDHALQAAAAAQAAQADDECILAALFHDIGHLLPADAPQMDGLGVQDHEALGADFLFEHGVSHRVAKLVRCHVQAKRYLCWKNPAYATRLSPASKGTLAWQGGPMIKAEAEAFEKDPDCKAILALRSWDEMAKDPEAEVAPLLAYRDMLSKHLTNNRVAMGK